MNTEDFNSKLLTCRQSLKVYAFSLTKNVEDANDLVQETLLKAMLNRDTFSDTNINAWVLRIARNLYLNSVTKLSAKNTCHNILDNDDMIKNTWGHDRTAEVKIATDDIALVLSKLDSDYNIPLTMFLNGYKYKEIAETTNLPIGTVKSRIFFARKMVAGQLKDFR